MQMHVSKRNHYLGWLKSGDGDTDKDWNRSLIFEDMLQGGGYSLVGCWSFSNIKGLLEK